MICQDQLRANLSSGHEYRGEGSPPEYRGEGSPSGYRGEESPPSPGDIHMWPCGAGDQGHPYCHQVRQEKKKEKGEKIKSNNKEEKEMQKEKEK